MIGLKINNSDLITIWKSVRLMVQNELFTTESEGSYLREVMSKIAEKQQMGREDDSAFPISLEPEYAYGIWRSMQVAIEEDMFPVEAHARLCEIMGLISIQLDQALDSEESLSE